MKFLIFLGGLFGLPALAALGHDLYKAYLDGMLEGKGSLQLSDFGWLWLEYHRPSYDWARANIDPALWKSVCDPVLEQTAALAAGVPSLFFFAAALLIKLCVAGPWGLNARVRVARGGFSFGDSGRKGRARYKRK